MEVLTDALRATRSASKALLVPPAAEATLPPPAEIRCVLTCNHTFATCPHTQADTPENFLEFTPSKNLTPADRASLRHLRSLRDYDLNVLGDYVLHVGVDVIDPLAPGQWVTDPIINSRLALL